MATVVMGKIVFWGLYHEVVLKNIDERHITFILLSIMHEILNIDALTKKFRLSSKHYLTALDQISLTLEQGEVMAVLGPNGSGKSTLFKCILGYLKPNAGSMRLFGKDMRFNEIRSGLGFLYEKVSFYPELTPVELMRFYGRLLNLSASAIDSEIKKWLELVDLEKFSREPIANFSKGMVQRVGLAVALIGDPPFLILDEPTSGLDIFGIYKMQSILAELKHRGKTLLISSHNISHIQDFTDTYLVIKQGKLLWKGCKDSIENKASFKTYNVHLVDVPRFEVLLDKENITCENDSVSSNMDAWLKSFYD